MRTRSIRGEKVKGKVLTGFVLLFILTLGGIFAVIFFARDLRPPDTDVSQAVTKLTLVSNMLSGLIDADGQSRAYITSGKKVYYEKYLSDQKQITILADSLKKASLSHTEQYLRMLVVDSLLKIKHSTLESFFRLQRSSGSPILSEDRLDKIVESFNDTLSTATQTITPKSQGNGGITVSRKGSAEENEKKGNVFKRLWGGLTGKNDQTDTIVIHHKAESIHFDTTHTYVSLKDTAIQNVRTQLRRMGVEEREARQSAIERELMLLRTDQSILDEIRNVLILFEKEEINGAIAGSEKANQVLNRLWETALILALASVLIMFVFILLIWKDLAKSSFYRRQLEQARMLAERLLKVKELFLANMSHEIRTPITSVIGFSERIGQTRLNEEQKEYLDYIIASSDHLLGLVDDLLDFSRIESGKFNLEMSSFNPASVLRQSFETLRPKGEQKGLNMRYVFEGDEQKLMLGDALRLRQIVYNLLNNSIKFTEKGEVSLEVALDSGEGQLLQITVTDTGIGIPEEKQKLIFEEFTQVDDSITRRYGGSGLGLAICLKLTALMNGEIKLDSRENEGSTFTVTLPFVDGELPADAGSTERAVVPDLTGIRVLLAEDDDTTRKLLSTILTEAGAQVTTALDGKNARELFEQGNGNYQLLITDINMPGMSGTELATSILKSCEASQLDPPLILGLTAHATPREAEKFQTHGINNLLIKPFRKRQLFAAIVTLLPETNRGQSTEIVEVEEIVSMLSPGFTFKSSYDLSKFADYADGDQNALRAILMSLVSGLESTRSEMQEALEKKDYPKLSLLAHRTLPNMRNLGAAELVSMLVEIEKMRNGFVPKLPVLNDRITSCLNELQVVQSSLTETLNQE